MAEVSLAAGLFKEAGFADYNAAGEALAHIVNGESGSRCAGEGFHFHTSLVGGLDRTFYMDTRWIVKPDGETDAVKGKRMAEGYEICGPFDSLSASDDGGLEDGPLPGLDFLLCIVRKDSLGEIYNGACRGGTPGGSLVRDIDHAGLAVVVEVCEHGRKRKEGMANLDKAK